MNGHKHERLDQYYVAFCSIQSKKKSWSLSGYLYLKTDGKLFMTAKHSYLDIVLRGLMISIHYTLQYSEKLIMAV